jgi:hypothetical protein
MFPLSLEGTIDLPDGNTRAALDQLRYLLVAARAKNVEQKSDSLAFQGGMFRPVTSANILYSVDQCEVTARESKLFYSFSTKQMLALVSVVIVAGCISFWTLSGEARQLPVGWWIALFVFGWLWIFGANYLLASIRLRKFLKKAVASYNAA